MIARFDPRPEDLQRLQVGPIGPHVSSFAALVVQQGYCSVTGWLKVRLVANGVVLVLILRRNQSRAESVLDGKAHRLEIIGGFHSEKTITKRPSVC